MSNERIARLISERLRAGGLTHPGDPDNGVPPMPIALPFASRAGMGKEMSELMDVATTQLGEAIVHLIEVDGGSEIVPRDELGALRLATGDQLPEKRIPVFCRCDRQRQNPLTVLTMTTPDRVIVDGRALIRQLAGKEAAHPHKPVTS